MLVIHVTAPGEIYIADYSKETKMRRVSLARAQEELLIAASKDDELENEINERLWKE